MRVVVRGDVKIEWPRKFRTVHALISVSGAGRLLDGFCARHSITGLALFQCLHSLFS